MSAGSQDYTTGAGRSHLKDDLIVALRERNDLAAENAALREERARIIRRAENAEAVLMAEVAKNGRHAMRVTIAQLEARLQKVMARCADLLDEDQFNELDAIASSASVCLHQIHNGDTCEICGAKVTPVVQPERCCLDYPRCDCNSPPEPDNALACGHPSSLLLRSAETGEALYCELCDDKSGRRDAEQCETELRAEVERLKTALKTVGDDYPGSSCQQWCYEAAGIRAPTLQPCGHPWKAQHDFKCILCSSPKVTP